VRRTDLQPVVLRGTKVELTSQRQSTDAGASLLDLLDLEAVGADCYRAPALSRDRTHLYGGQVAAQALLAAGRTVSPSRLPHSLHGYFLRGGDATEPTLFRVERDRDGRSFSSRRVVALQRGEVIFSMSASFHVAEEGLDLQVDAVPQAEPPEPLELSWAESESFLLFSFEARVPAQPFPAGEMPTRLWLRPTVALPDDPLVHACVLTYLSDSSSGLMVLRQDGWRDSSSLDHAVWFHRPVRLDEWVLLDVVPRTTAGGRGWYTGSVATRNGVLGASFTQEALFRRAPDAK
jgi:acyl-CoA thioesterase-2